MCLACFVVCELLFLCDFVVFAVVVALLFVVMCFVLWFCGCFVSVVL